MDAWLPKDHLARFVVEIVGQFDLSALVWTYRGSGREAYNPAILTALLIYGYATGVYSSRATEKASYESIAVRYVAANESSDHDTLCAFRRQTGGHAVHASNAEMFNEIAGVDRADHPHYIPGLCDMPA